MFVKGLLLMTGFLFTAGLPAQDATEIVRRADEKQRGEISGISEMSMHIIRPRWDRTVEFKMWSKGTDRSMVLVTAPAEEKGQSFLKVGNEMWRWSPTLNRTIKLPPALLAQGWLGSDFTNDDMINQRSIVVDYIHIHDGKETVGDEVCYKIVLKPKEEASVVWGKITLWISQSEYLILKSEYYDEDMELVKTEVGSDIKDMDGTRIPTVYEIIPADDDGQKTVITLKRIQYNANLNDDFFSIQRMKNLRESD